MDDTGEQTQERYEPKADIECGVDPWLYFFLDAGGIGLRFRQYRSHRRIAGDECPCRGGCQFLI